MYPDSVNDQPSYVDSIGNKEWYKNGQRHRDGGPARERADGTKEWYLNGVKYTSDQFLQKKASQLTIESSKTNTTNSICYFCGEKTVPFFGRKMICSVCRK